MTSMLAIASLNSASSQQAGRSIGYCRQQFQCVSKGCCAASARLAEYGEGGLGSFFDDFKERATRATRRALALLPIAHGLDRHANTGGEGSLGQTGSSPHIAGV